MTSEPSDLVKAALNGRKFVDEGAAVAAAPTITGDYKKLFAAYQALNTLSAIANRSDEKGVTDSEIKRLQAVFSKGLNEVNSYVQNLSTDGMRLTTGAVMTSDKSTVGVPKSNYTYVTNKIYSGQVDDEVPTFKGAVSFTMNGQEVRRGDRRDHGPVRDGLDAPDDGQRGQLLQRQAGRPVSTPSSRSIAHRGPGAHHHRQRPDRQAAGHRRRLRPAGQGRPDRDPDLLGPGRQAGGLHHHGGRQSGPGQEHDHRRRGDREHPDQVRPRHGRHAGDQGVFRHAGRHDQHRPQDHDRAGRFALRAGRCGRHDQHARRSRATRTSPC
jgi:hypothetical protein